MIVTFVIIIVIFIIIIETFIIMMVIFIIMMVNFILMIVIFIIMMVIFIDQIPKTLVFWTKQRNPPLHKLLPGEKSEEAGRQVS